MEYTLKIYSKDEPNSNPIRQPFEKYKLKGCTIDRDVAEEIFNGEPIEINSWWVYEYKMLEVSKMNPEYVFVTFLKGYHYSNTTAHVFFQGWTQECPPYITFYSAVLPNGKVIHPEF